MNEVAIRRDWVGEAVDGRFTLLQWLGGSRRSGVFLAELLEDRSQKVAIKLIPADTVDAEAHIAAWARTKALSHPHLMRLIHTGRCQIDAVPLLYVATEYADEALSQILPERPLTPSETGEMLEAVLDALSYLHGNGFVHGHLKPANIMAVVDQLKLSSDSLQVAGEPGRQFPAPSVYDAPEVAAGTISQAADVWSLGVTLVEALTQHPPVWDGMADGKPVVPESIPQPFAAIAQECLQHDPARRCTLSDVKARLAPSPSLAVPAGKPQKTASARLRVPAIVTAAFVLIAVIAVLLLRSRQTQPSQPTEQQPTSAISAPPAQSPTVPPAQPPAAPPAQLSAEPPPQSPVTPSVESPAESQALSPSAPPAQFLVPETQANKGATVKGEVAQRVLPDVPRKASATIRGTAKVGIRVAVDTSGNVSNAALDSPGSSRYFSNLALQAARQWRFKPAQVGGQAVSSQWILEFQFRQSGTEVAPVQVSP
jgi:TonB family protein